ncbi:MAG: hypothetical protein HQL03_02285 [Nitrospirae bacterium]|nr:hypothetical protein [Nitrospirota bacterium]
MQDDVQHNEDEFEDIWQGMPKPETTIQRLKREAMERKLIQWQRGDALEPYYKSDGGC